MPKRRPSPALGEATYRDGALERLGDAYRLLTDGRFAGSVYMAGRGVEAILRALIWRGDPDIRTGKKALETGHSLRELLMVVQALGLLRYDLSDREIASGVQRVGRL